VPRAESLVLSMTTRALVVAAVSASTASGDQETVPVQPKPTGKKERTASKDKRICDP
jgi:hypothetical protein